MQKVFVLVRTEEIMPPFPFKQLPSFSQACHFVHQNMGHSVRLRVYNCSCFQLNRPERANPEPRTLAMYTTFPSSLNISSFRFTPKPSVLFFFPHFICFTCDEISLILLNTSGLWHTSKSSHSNLLAPSHSLFTHLFNSLQADKIHFKTIP